MSAKWDRWFLGMAEYVATASKDPSTRCGAVIVDRKRRVVAVGYNGLARGVTDDPARLHDRDTKLAVTVHAEVNAILFAGRDLTGCTLYAVPFASCSRCAAVVIQSGITRCVAPVTPPHLLDRWGRALELSAMMFREAGVELCLVDDLPPVTATSASLTPSPLSTPSGNG